MHSAMQVKSTEPKLDTVSKPESKAKRGRPMQEESSTVDTKRAKLDESFGALNKLAEIVQAALDLNKKDRFNHKNCALSEEQLSKPITKDSFVQWDANVGQNIVHGLKLFMVGSGKDDRAYVQLPKALQALESLRAEVQAHEASKLEVHAKLEERDKTIKTLQKEIEELKKPAATAASLIGAL